jgi:hypothetical protein
MVRGTIIFPVSAKSRGTDPRFPNLFSPEAQALAQLGLQVVAVPLQFPVHDTDVGGPVWRKQTPQYLAEVAASARKKYGSTPIDLEEIERVRNSRWTGVSLDFDTTLTFWQKMLEGSGNDSGAPTSWLADLPSSIMLAYPQGTLVDESGKKFRSLARKAKKHVEWYAPPYSTVDHGEWNARMFERIASFVGLLGVPTQN